MQPKISATQINFENPNGLVQQYEITALTKINGGQEIFVGGLCLEIDSADNTTSPDEFTIAGDYTAFFETGVVFHVAGSASNDADYTTVANATFAAGFTTIYVTNGAITTNESAGLGTGFISTGNRLVLPDDSTTLITIFAVAHSTAANEGAGYIQKAVFRRGTGAGSVVRIGVMLDDLTRADLTGTPAAPLLSADTTNGSARIEFNSGSSNLTEWKALLVLQQLTL